MCIRDSWETHITEYGKAENIRIHCKAYWKCSATAELADIPYCDNSGTQRHHCEKRQLEFPASNLFAQSIQSFS